jgi:hypothetical protein
VLSRWCEGGGEGEGGQDAGELRRAMLGSMRREADEVFGEGSTVHCMSGSPRTWGGELGLVLKDGIRSIVVRFALLSLSLSLSLSSRRSAANPFSPRPRSPPTNSATRTTTSPTRPPRTATTSTPTPTTRSSLGPSRSSPISTCAKNVSPIPPLCTLGVPTISHFEPSPPRRLIRPMDPLCKG